MGILGLSDAEEALLTRIILNQAMLGECEGSSPTFLDPGQTLWAWFGFDSEQEVRGYQAQLLGVLGEHPRVQQALSEKEWHIAWREGKYYLTYGNSVLARAKTGFAEGLVAARKKKSVLWFMAGIAIGMVTVRSNLKPEALLIPRMLVFLLAFSFYGFVSLLGGMFLFAKITGSLDGNRAQWTRTQRVSFLLILAVALAIGASMGVWMCREVQHDNNPWREEVEQTHPW